MNKTLLESIGLILNIQPEAVTLETSTKNTSSWDSLAHLRLILELERNLGIRFRSQDIPELTSVAKLNEAISKYMLQKTEPHHSKKMDADHR